MRAIQKQGRPLLNREKYAEEIEAKVADLRIENTHLSEQNLRLNEENAELKDKLAKAIAKLRTASDTGRKD